jgi:hypothetical protein
MIVAPVCSSPFCAEHRWLAGKCHWRFRKRLLTMRTSA